jgi:hypothetical protein
VSPRRWLAAAAILAAGAVIAAFAAELIRPRPSVVGTSGYKPPVPTQDNRVVLPI